LCALIQFVLYFVIKCVCYNVVSRKRSCKSGDSCLSKWYTARIYAYRNAERVGQESRFVIIL